jgi:hypothetical protein
VATVSVTVGFSNHCATSHNYEGAKFQIISKLHAFEKKLLKKIIFSHKMQAKKRTVGYYRKAIVTLP